MVTTKLLLFDNFNHIEEEPELGKNIQRNYRFFKINVQKGIIKKFIFNSYNFNESLKRFNAPSKEKLQL